MLVVCANRFRSNVWIHHGERKANGKSILEVMTLLAPSGSKLSIEAEGVDSEQVVNELADIVRRGFDE